MISVKTRCLIVDDEPLAINLIRSHIGKLDSFEVAGECRNALKAIEFLKNGKIDLMFLDIKMPEITGLDFLKTLSEPPYVIITTAYREYAVEGYDLDVVDFLLKPISFEGFLKSINRYTSRINTGQETRKIELSTTGESNYIHLHDGKNTFRLVYDEVIYFEGYGEYVKVVTKGKNFLVRDTLAKFESRFSTGHFLRIHKSYIVNIHSVIGFNASQVFLEDNTLPIGRLYRESVNGFLK